ncbi:MAG TPA: alpha/beta fold hydrolase [Thermoanaerobaculia bacterium]|jgi:pimeloyl-ACP methyl ester carboxylesterase
MTRPLLLLFVLALSAGAEERRYVDVPENHKKPNGRQLSLEVRIVPAKEKRDADPIFFLAGGPGQVAVTTIEWVSEIFAEANQTRDIVFADYRGATERNLLACKTKASEADPAGYFVDLFSGDVLARCRDELSEKWDLTQYHTSNIVEDVELVRRKLGYRQINLYGSSYGTRVAHEYMRRYPANVRGAILDGATAPSFIMPGHYAPDAEKSLQRVFALCAEDPSCHAKYPELEKEWARLLDEASARGIEVVLPNNVRAKVSRGLFGEVMRNTLYSQDSYVLLPKMIHLAANGDRAMFARQALRVAQNSRYLVTGMFVAVTCTDDLPRLDVAKARQAARGTLLGSYRIDVQLAACRIFPRGERDVRASQPLRVSVPTLILSGELDPVTSPRFGDELVETLPNAKHVVIPYASHGKGTPCPNKILNDFVKAGSVEKVDTSCVAGTPRPVFE